MAKPKKKKNPGKFVKESDLRNLKRDVVGQSYRTFMAVALTTYLDKYQQGGEVIDYLADMNSLLDEVMKGHVTVDDLAGVLDDEYDIRLDYEEIK
jgi:hypothetical protein